MLYVQQQQYKLFLMDSPHSDKSHNFRQLPALTEAYQVHQDLIKTISEMDTKIEEVIRTHQAEFLLAYRNHIKTMKEELMMIKQRSDEQQKKIMSNERTVFLQKQIILFREEALRLYDKLQEKTQQNQSNKSHGREMEKVKGILERENKEQAKLIKTLETQLVLQNARMEQLKEQVGELRGELRVLNEKGVQSKGATVNTKHETQGLADKLVTPAAGQSMVSQMGLHSRRDSKGGQLVSKLSGGSKLMMLKERRKLGGQYSQHQLKNCFVQCLQTIRREVAQRKAYGYRTQELQGIASWEQFRMIDKLRLLEMFMQNEKLLVWMYEKIFPGRMAEIENYFSGKKGTDSREKSKSMQIRLDDIPFADLAEPADFDRVEMTGSGVVGEVAAGESGLPRVGASWKKEKVAKYDVRGKIEMRSGKLSLKRVVDEK